MAPGGARWRPGERGPRRGALDGDQAFELQPPYAGIHGWAVAEPDLARVELDVGGEVVRARPLATSRPDVARRSTAASAPISGWEAPVDLTGREPGERIPVRARAVGGGRNRELGRADLVVGRSRTPAAAQAEWLATLRERADARIRPTRDHEAEGMRLAVFTHQLDLGGAQLYLQELLRLLLADGSIRCAVYAQMDGQLREQLESWGATVHITGQEPRLGSIYESRMAELALLVGEFAPTVALVNTTVAFWGVDTAKRMGVPVAWAIHESVPVHHYPHLVWPPLDGHLTERFIAALRSADAVVFQADATRRLYDEYVDSSRALKIGYGIDLAAVDAERRVLDRDGLRAGRGIAAADRLIVCMGTIEPRKAQAALAVCFARLARDHPDTTLALVGDRDSDYSRGLRAATARLDLGDRIRIEPVTGDTSSWYECADVFALPSDLESLPRTIIEAMAFELPVLAADAFGITELVADGENGFLCEPRCLDSLTTALDRVLSLDRSELSALGRCGAGAVRRAHDSAGYAAAYRRLLAELTSPGRASAVAAVSA